MSDKEEHKDRNWMFAAEGNFENFASLVRVESISTLGLSKHFHYSDRGYLDYERFNAGKKSFRQLEDKGKQYRYTNG